MPVALSRLGDRLGLRALPRQQPDQRAPLITHCANDRQIPVADAYRTYKQATCSPKRELKIFSEREGGAEHTNVARPSCRVG